MKNGVLLDTNILVDLFRGLRGFPPRSPERQYYATASLSLLEELTRKNMKIYISCHTLKELLQYRNISEQEENRINNRIPTIATILDTNEEVARAAATLSREAMEYQRDHIEDCYIAATAIVYGIPLLTRNPADFEYVKHKRLNVIQPYKFDAGRQP